jgi:hypothetical protein
LSFVDRISEDNMVEPVAIPNTAAIEPGMLGNA